MALLRRKSSTRQPARWFTAAATEINLEDEAEKRTHEKRPKEWQRQAWRYYDELGEVRYAGRYMGDAQSRIRLFAAVQPEPDEPPAPVTSEDLDISDAVQSAAMAAVARLTSPDGGTAEIMRELGLNVFQVGEAYLVGQTTDDGERFDVYSVEELIINSAGNYAIKGSPDAAPDQAKELDDDAFVLRIYRRHPRFSDWPDSHMRAALEYCEELQILTRSIRAVATSQIAAGILKVPNEASTGGPDPTTDLGDGEATDDPLTRDLMTHLSAPIKNPRSAAAIVPFILRAEIPDLAATEHIDLSRPFDRLAIDLREEVRAALATTIDLPAEVLTNKAELNHWTAWQVDEESFKAHIEPLTVLLVGALTTGYYRPALRAAGVADAERHLIWYDPSALVAHPNRAENARMGHDRYAISDDSFRRSLGFSDDDAPDDDEVERRVAIAAARRGRELPTSPITEDEGRQALPETTEPGPPEQGPPDVDTASLPPLRAVAAAMLPEGLGTRLASMERGLRLRIQQAADDALRRALERAGNQLRSRAAKDPTLRDAVSSTPSWRVAAVLGPSHIERLGLDDDGLFAGAWDQLEGRYRHWVSRAQREAVREAVRFRNAPFTDDEFAEFERRMEEDREEGWLVLLGLLGGLAAVRLYRPEIEPPAFGEFDDTTLVPPGPVRASLARAGGAVGETIEGGVVLTGGGVERAAGLFSGDTILEMFRLVGVNFAGYTWIYGDPSTRIEPFEPHHGLAGVRFDSWTDEALANGSGQWPYVAHFSPGDHLYCQCDFAREIAASPPLAA